MPACSIRIFSDFLAIKLFSDFKICCNVSTLSKDIDLLMHFFSFLYIFFFSVVAANDLIVRSVITLDNNVPSECGLSFDSPAMISKVMIKKNKEGTSTVFTIKSNNEAIKNVNIKTNSIDLMKLLNKEIKQSKDVFIESITDENKTSAFFQELLIGGGNFFLNDKKFEIIGPIDSKVRLEYLFCTGEMFLPNYN